MEFLQSVFGSGESLEWYQMSARGIIIFVLTILMLRIAGQRTFGKKSAIDNVVVITLGAVLSRAVVGASPFIPVIVTGFCTVLAHRLIAWLCMRYEKLGIFIKGKRTILFRNGNMILQNMNSTLMSREDIEEGVRLQTNKDNMKGIRAVYLEKGGEITVDTDT